MYEQGVLMSSLALQGLIDQSIHKHNTAALFRQTLCRQVLRLSSCHIPPASGAGAQHLLRISQTYFLQDTCETSPSKQPRSQIVRFLLQLCLVEKSLGYRHALCTVMMGAQGTSPAGHCV